MISSTWYLVLFVSSDAAAHSDNSNVYSWCPPPLPQPETATTTTTTTISSDKLLLVLWCSAGGGGGGGGAWLEDGCSRRSLVPATCYLVGGGILIYYVHLYACFSQDDPWYLVSRPFNIAQLRELGRALNTTSRGALTCYLAGSRKNVRFEIGRVVVTHVTEGDVGDVCILWCEYQSEDERYNLSKNKNSRAAIAVPTTTSKAQVRVTPCQLATLDDGAGHADEGRSVRFECVWEKKWNIYFCVCPTLSCHDKLGIKYHLIEVLFGHKTNYM